MPTLLHRDVTGYNALRWLNLALVAAQLAAGYSALTAFVYAAKKDD